MEWGDLIWCDLDQRGSSRNLCYSKLQNFCAQLFQLQNYFCAQYFRFFCLQGFHFHFSMWHYKAIPCRKDPIYLWRSWRCRIWQTVRISDCGHNGSIWFHPSAGINIPPVYGNINTTIQTPEGVVALTTV